jgi:hypothetical protein
MVVGLVVLAVIAVGVETKIDTSIVHSSGLLGSSKLGWQLIYILPVAVLTNDFFLSVRQDQAFLVQSNLFFRASGCGHLPRRLIRI